MTTPAADLRDRTAPDAASGAVPVPADGATVAAAVPPLRERDFWHAVLATLVATLAPWPR